MARPGSTVSVGSFNNKPWTPASSRPGTTKSSGSGYVQYVQAAGNDPFMTAKLRPSPVKFTRAPATPIAPPPLRSGHGDDDNLSYAASLEVHSRRRPMGHEKQVFATRQTYVNRGGFRVRKDNRSGLSRSRMAPLASPPKAMYADPLPPTMFGGRAATAAVGTRREHFDTQAVLMRQDPGRAAMQALFRTGNSAQVVYPARVVGVCGSCCCCCCCCCS